MDNLKEFKELIGKIKLNLKKNIGKSFFKKLSRELREDMQERVRDGYGNSQDEMGHKRKKFKKLKDSTVKQRTRMKEAGKLSSKTSPNTSNQTATGKMVDDLKEYSSKDSLSIEIKKDRRKVYEAQEEKGRPWLYLTKKETNKVDKNIEDAIEKSLDDLFD